MKLFIALMVFALFFGCIEGPLENPVEPQTPVGLDNNGFEKLLINTNSFNLDLDENKIAFNFEIDLNSANLDLNILTSSCSLACDAIDANSWRVSKDLNFGGYFCICTRLFCPREEQTDTQIIKYCSEKGVALEFVEGKR